VATGIGRQELAQLYHDGNEILAELDIWEAIIDFAPMAPMDR
jgi:hypothetical protein